MKQRMDAYINELCGSDIDALKRLIATQYKQFLHFYRLVENVSEDIDSLEYDMTRDTLSVTLTMRKKSNIMAIGEMLKSEAEKHYESYTADIDIDENVILMSVDI